MPNCLETGKMTDIDTQDRRVQRTLTSLRQAFYELVLSTPYDDITVGDLIEKADVGRSTFYQHYSGKDDILRVSLHAPMSAMAQAVKPHTKGEDLQPILEHFWENRQFARRILTGSQRKQVIDCLSSLIEKELHIQWKSVPVAPLIPHKLTAYSLAEAQMTFVTGWILGSAHCKVDALANSIVASSRATVVALIRASESHVRL